MNILALRGVGNSGKTTTIKLLHGLFLNNSYQVVSITFNPQDGDFRTIFIKNGKLIGITSSGDTFDLVNGNLEALINGGCILCVCACRTYDQYGQGTNAAIDTFLPNYQKQYIDKTVAVTSAQEQQSNRNVAQTFFYYGRCTSLNYEGAIEEALN
jgi:hypothetical protein